jgi:hypothetical protein
MTKGVVDARRKKFVQLMVDVTDVAGLIKAYKEAYPQCKKDDSARAAGYRLLQDVEIVRAIDQLKKQKEELIQKAQAEEIQRLARERIASQPQLEAILSDIALGRFKRKKVIAAIDPKTKSLVKAEVEESPEESAMIAAADKLFKIKGSYAPKVLKHDGTDKFFEFMQSFADISNKDIPQHVQPESE